MHENVGRGSTPDDETKKARLGESANVTIGSSTASWAPYLNSERAPENRRTRERICTAQMAYKSPSCDKVRPRSAIDVSLMSADPALSIG